MIGAMAPPWASACCLAAVGRHACAHKPLGTLWQNIVGSVQALVKRFGSENSLNGYLGLVFSNNLSYGPSRRRRALPTFGRI